MNRRRSTPPPPPPTLQELRERLEEWDAAQLRHFLHGEPRSYKELAAAGEAERGRHKFRALQRLGELRDFWAYPILVRDVHYHLPAADAGDDPWRYPAMSALIALGSQVADLLHLTMTNRRIDAEERAALGTVLVQIYINQITKPDAD